MSFEKPWKMLLYDSLPRSLSIKFGFHFELIIIFSEESFLAWAVLFFKGIVQPNFEKLSMIT